MKQVLRTISFLGLFLFIEGFLLSVSARTETTNKEVLVLNSINFNLPWAKNFYWCIHDALQKQGISAKAESLSVPALANKMEADAVVTHLREKYPVAPAAIVLIGDPGWIVGRELFDDVWKDVPVIVTNARDRLPASLDVLLSHAPLTETNSVPGEEWRRGYNLTLLKQHYYVKETVELIYKLIPDMQRLAFISDDRYISEETRRDVKEAVEENFPDLRLDLLSTTQLSTEMLLDTLHSYKPNTGIIYYSWFESPFRPHTGNYNQFYSLTSVFAISRKFIEQYFRRRILCIDGVFLRFFAGNPESHIEWRTSPQYPGWSGRGRKFLSLLSCIKVL